MSAQQINRVAGKVLMALSLTALLTVLSGFAQRPQADEGTAAHIFQLSVAATAPMILLFLVTADWRQPLRSARPVVLPAVALALAFALLSLPRALLVGCGAAAVSPQALSRLDLDPDSP